MCLAPKIIINRHYLKITNNNRVQALDHFGQEPDFYIKVDCGLCVECQRKRGNNWKTRLIDEYHYFLDKFPDRKVHFCTLTCAPEFYSDFKENPNRFIRLFLERYRKRYGKSFKHWIVSEYGEKRGRLHLHMIAFGALFDVQELRSLWSYGRVDLQTLKGPQGLTYVSGYVNKVVKGDKLSKQDIPLFISKDKKTYIWTSPKLGLGYALDYANRRYHSQNNNRIFIRQRENGSPFSIPRYYLDKLFSPVDLYNRKVLYFKQMFELPKPPYKVLYSYYNDLSTYFQKIHSLGGTPLIMSTQFNLLTPEQKNFYFYGK